MLCLSSAHLYASPRLASPRNTNEHEEGKKVVGRKVDCDMLLLGFSLSLSLSLSQEFIEGGKPSDPLSQVFFFETCFLSIIYPFIYLHAGA
jgi:hypothetical protein